MSEVVEQPIQIGNKQVKLPESVKVKGIVSIKPYISGKPNMGHEKYDEVLFPGTEQEDTVFCLSRDNIRTYTTGLNEFSSDIQSIEDPKKKEAKIKAIRETVAFLENTANANFKVSPKDCMANYSKISDRGESLDSFWENVTMFQSVCVDKFDAKGNRIPTYWDRLVIILTNEGRQLNVKDPHDLAIYHVIKAGGFGLIASSLQQAIDEQGYNFYLHKPEDVADIKAEFKILRNEAGGYLESMRKDAEKSNSSKLFYLAIMCASVGAGQYKREGASSTPIKQLYLDIDNFISGKVIGMEPERAVDKVLEYYNMPDLEIKVRAVVKVAMELRLIDLRPNGQMAYKQNIYVGKTIEEVVVYMQHPGNDETWETLLKEIEGKWRE